MNASELEVLVRFLKFIHKSRSCWLWTGGKDRYGYGSFSVNGKMKKAPRVAYELFVGPIPKGLNVLHRCDNPPCVNPKHLYAGTFLDNSNDCKNRGRMNREKGEDRYCAKLTEKQVREIKRRLINPPVNISALSREFKISRMAIYFIKYGKRWRHVK